MHGRARARRLDLAVPSSGLVRAAGASSANHVPTHARKQRKREPCEHHRVENSRRDWPRPGRRGRQGSGSVAGAAQGYAAEASQQLRPLPCVHAHCWDRDTGYRPLVTSPSGRCG
ncbi:hypothetical protein SEVIR_4G021066v4 [Setaria viridis]